MTSSTNTQDSSTQSYYDFSSYEHNEAETLLANGHPSRMTFAQMCYVQDWLLEGAFDGDPIRLGQGAETMPVPKRMRLELARRRVPRFLFRVFRSDSGGGNSAVGLPNLGAAILNNILSVTPHAFVDPKKAPTYAAGCVYDIGEQRLANMVQNHVSGAHVLSRFSSWAASLDTALWSCYDKDGRKYDNCYLAVIDTTTITNDIFHVQQLWRAGLVRTYDPSVTTTTYLIHGPVSGQGYFCKKIAELEQHGFRELAATGWKNYDEKTQSLKYDQLLPITEHRLEEAFMRAVQCAQVFMRRQIRPFASAVSKKRKFNSVDYHQDDVLLFLIAAFVGHHFARFESFSQGHLDTLGKAIVRNFDRPLQLSSQFWDQDWLVLGNVYKIKYYDIKKCVKILNRVQDVMEADEARAVAERDQEAEDDEEHRSKRPKLGRNA